MTRPAVPRRFDDRVVLVVRAGSVFGAAACQRLAAEGARIHHHEGDASDGPDRRRAVEACLGTFGRLDVLIASPVDVPEASFLAMSADDYSAAVDSALQATFFLVQEAARAMPEGGRVCVASAPRPARIPAEMSAPATLLEGGLVALVRLLAVELAPAGIALNAVCPVPVAAEPPAVAATFAFLASTDASYVTGAFLPSLGPGTSAAGAVSALDGAARQTLDESTLE